MLRHRSDLQKSQGHGHGYGTSYQTRMYEE